MVTQSARMRAAVLALAIAGLWLGLAEPGGAQIEVNPPDSIVARDGSRIEVPLLLRNPMGTSISAFGMDVIFPPSLLQYDTLDTAGTFVSGYTLVDGALADSNLVRLGVIDLAGGRSDTAAVLIKLLFRARTGVTGSDSLRLRNFTDALQGAMTRDGRITIVDNLPPVIGAIPDTIAFEDVPFELQVIASDPDSGDTLRYSLPQAPAWLGIDADSGLLSGTPRQEDTGIFTVTVAVEDRRGATATASFVLGVIEVNDPPVITPLPDTLVAVQDQLFTFQVDASDPDDVNLIYSLRRQPAWLSIDRLSGLLSGTPGNADVGFDSVVVIVEDGRDGVAADSLVVHVVDVNDPPVLQAIPDTTILQDQAFRYQVVASDPDGDPLTYGLGTIATWLVIGDSTGVLSGTPGNDDVGVYTVNVVVYDNRAGSDTTSFRLEVINVNDPPAPFDLVAPGDASILDTLNFTLNWQVSIDIDPDDQVSYSVVVAPVADFSDTTIFVSGLLDTFFTISGTPAGLEANGTYYWQVAAEDQHGGRTGSASAWSFLTSASATDVGGGDSHPATFELAQNYPNPFNPETQIRFSVPRTAAVRLAIYSLLGQRIAVLADREFAAGTHAARWDGRMEDGRAAPSGIYLLLMQTGDFRQVRKIMLAK